MIHFLIGFYFGGVLATWLGFTAAGLQYEWAADLILSKPLSVLVLVLFWPYTLLKSLYNLMH